LAQWKPDIIIKDKSYVLFAQEVSGI